MGFICLYLWKKNTLRMIFCFWFKCVPVFQILYQELSFFGLKGNELKMFNWGKRVRKIAPGPQKGFTGSPHVALAVMK